MANVDPSWGFFFQTHPGTGCPSRLGFDEVLPLSFLQEQLFENLEVLLPFEVGVPSRAGNRANGRCRALRTAGSWRSGAPCIRWMSPCN